MTNKDTCQLISMKGLIRDSEELIKINTAWESISDVDIFQKDLSADMENLISK